MKTDTYVPLKLASQYVEIKTGVNELAYAQIAYVKERFALVVMLETVEIYVQYMQAKRHAIF